MPARHLSFRYGDELIHIERVARTADNGRVMVKVQPDCRVLVMAPSESSDAVVLAAVQKRSRWIYQHLRDFREQHKDVRPRRYVSGESHFYLGKRYLLKIMSHSAPQPSVKLTRGKIEVTAKDLNSASVQTLLDTWYRNRAKDIFSKRLETVLEQAMWVRGVPPISIRRMQTQWGSCSPNGRLTLNPDLVKAPRDCIDYVILHELCHIAEHNHSQKFYRLMNRVMPGWEKVKTRLDGMAGAILNN
jgi:predicted metal-dependent hydrolase